MRSTGATGVNADSSRSHAILQLEVKVVNAGDHVGRYFKIVFTVSQDFHCYDFHNNLIKWSGSKVGLLCYIKTIHNILTSGLLKHSRFKSVNFLPSKLKSPCKNLEYNL